MPYLSHILSISLLMCFSLTGQAAKESVIVADATTGRVFVQKDADKKRPVASLTKVATAVVVLDWVKVSGAKLSSYAIVPQEVLSIGGSNPMRLQPGDQITLRDALYSALMGSDNVAAYTLADRVGRSLLTQRQRTGHPVKAFVAEMNTLAKALGMQRTKFMNPTGLDTAKQRGYSTAADMAVMSIHAMKDEAFAFYVKQTSRDVSYLRAGQKIEFTVKNTNKLLGQDDVIGLKTGTTHFAGQCLAACAEKQSLVKKLEDGRALITQRKLVSIVLGSDSRFPQTQAILSQGWRIFDVWREAGFPSGQKGARYLTVPKL